MSGLDEAWAAAQHSGDDYQPYSGEQIAKREERAERNSSQA